MPGELGQHVPGVLEGRAAGDVVWDVIDGINAAIREKTESSLVLRPVTAHVGLAEILEKLKNVASCFQFLAAMSSSRSDIVTLFVRPFVRLSVRHTFFFLS